MRPFRSSTAGRPSKIYDSLKHFGDTKYPDENFALPKKPDLATALGEQMLSNYWVPNEIAAWVRMMYRVAGKHCEKVQPPSNAFDEVDWSLAKDQRLHGFLVACSTDKLIGIDFGAQRIGPLPLQPAKLTNISRPMWAPDGSALICDGHSAIKSKIVVSVLSPRMQEQTLDVSSPDRPTSVCDWHPRESKNVYLQGGDASGYGMWRSRWDGLKSTKVEPQTHGGVITTMGSKVIGVGSANNQLYAFELQDDRCIRQNPLLGWPCERR